MRTGIDTEQVQQELLKGSFVTVNVYGDRMTLCAQYGKYNLLGNGEWEFKQFDTFHEMCSRLELFSSEASLIRITPCDFEEDIA